MNKNFIQGSRPYVYISASWLLILLVVVFPILYTVYISLTNMNVFHWTNYRFIGFGNYARALVNIDEGFLTALLRTVLWTVINLLLQVFIALGYAIMLNVDRLKFSRLYRTVLMIPWAVPGYISALIWRNGIFDNQFGLLNQLLSKLHAKTVDWLNGDVTAFISSLIVNLWLALPFMILMIYGGLQSIDRVYYEIAEIEGARLPSRIFKITIPMIRPILIPAVVITAFVTFKQFDIIYLMTQQTGSKTGANIHVVITYAFEKAFVTNNYGFSAALSVIIFIIMLIFSVINQKYMREESKVSKQ